MESYPSSSYGDSYSHFMASQLNLYAPPPLDEVPPPPPEAPPPPPEAPPPPSLSPQAKRKEKARRTVSVQDIPPTVGTEEVLYSAFAQFGKVEDVSIARSHLDSSRNAECLGTALVRFEIEAQANKVVQETREKLYMVGGMPRPIMACIADENQLLLEDADDNEELPVRILDVRSKSVGAEFAIKWRQLHRRQQKEKAALKKIYLKMESELAEKQEKVFKELFERYEIILSTSRAKGVDQLKAALRKR